PAAPRGWLGPGSALRWCSRCRRQRRASRATGPVQQIRSWATDRAVGRALGRAVPTGGGVDAARPRRAGDREKGAAVNARRSSHLTLGLTAAAEDGLASTT